MFVPARRHQDNPGVRSDATANALGRPSELRVDRDRQPAIHDCKSPLDLGIKDGMSSPAYLGLNLNGNRIMMVTLHAQNAAAAFISSWRMEKRIA
jgi:hypothetical protein